MVLLSQFVNGPNYLALPRNSQKWLIDKLIPTAGSFIFSGKSKAGKSFCVLDMMEAVSNPARHSWNGFPILKHGPVMFLQIDTPRDEWGDRVEKLTALGKDFSQVYFADLQSIPNFPFDIVDPLKANAQWLQAQVQLIKPVIVIIDTLRDAHSADENDATEMRNALLELLGACQPAITGIIAHRKKETQYMADGGADLMDDVRGSSGVVAKMDNIIQLTRTQLSWKGRANKGSVCIKQDEETGLIVLDGASAAEEALIRTTVQTMPKGSSQTDCAKAVCEALGWTQTNRLGGLTKLKSALRRIKPYLG